jgi:hypothetical protein
VTLIGPVPTTINCGPVTIVNTTTTTTTITTVAAPITAANGGISTSTDSHPVVPSTATTTRRFKRKRPRSKRKVRTDRGERRTLIVHPGKGKRPFRIHLVYRRLADS